MKILYVLPGDAQLPAPAEELAEVGMYCHTIQPSFISALTALQIANEADRCGATIVRVSRTADAMAAVSARKVAKSAFKIVIEVEPCAEPPRRIPRDILAGVDVWIFPDAAAVWPGVPAERVCIMPPYGAPLASIPLIKPAECASSPHRRLVWIGPIDGNYERLLTAIDSVAPGQQLRVCGTGKARHTMPLIRRSRVINTRPEQPDAPVCDTDSIVWLGEEYALADELAAADAIVQSGPTPTLLELRASSQQTPLSDFAALFTSL